MDYSQEFKERFIDRFGFDRLGFFGLDLTGWPMLILEHRTGTVEKTLPQSCLVICTDSYEPMYACYSWEGEITLRRGGNCTFVLKDGWVVKTIHIEKGILHVLSVKQCLDKLENVFQKTKPDKISNFAMEAAKLFDLSEQLAQLSWLALLSKAESVGLKVRCQKGCNRKVVTQMIIDLLKPQSQAIA